MGRDWPNNFTTTITIPWEWRGEEYSYCVKSGKPCSLLSHNIVIRLMVLALIPPLIYDCWLLSSLLLLPTGPNLLTAGSEKETATFNLLIVWFIALSEYALKLRIGRRLWELVCRHLLERGVDYKLDSRSRRKEENSNERRGICINTAPANRRSRIKMRTRELSSTIKVDCFE